MVDVAEEPGRRLLRRRGRSSLGGMSDSSVAEGDVSGLNEQVMGRATPPVSEPLSETESDVGSRTDAPQDFTPANRMQDVRTRATAYEREYRLKLLHRMLMRNVPLDQIANELGVSVSTVIRDRAELYRKLRDAAQRMDINELIGDTVGFYQEVRGMSLRAASASKAPLNMRLAAMRTAVGAVNDMHRFLGSVGVYDVLRYRVADSDSSSDIEKLVEITETLLSEKTGQPMDEMQSISDLPFMQGDDEEIEILR